MGYGLEENVFGVTAPRMCSDDPLQTPKAGKCYDLNRGNPMARKKSSKLSKRQKRNIRIQQIIFIAIALIIIASMIVSFVM
jgi:hypothetical protein